MKNDYLNKLVREAEAAEILSTPVKTLQQWRFRGNGPVYVKTGPRSIRYRMSDLQKWIDSLQPINKNFD